jgi:hypothetical protein
MDAERGRRIFIAPADPSIHGTHARTHTHAQRPGPAPPPLYCIHRPTVSIASHRQHRTPHATRISQHTPAIYPWRSRQTHSSQHHHHPPIAYCIVHSPARPATPRVWAFTTSRGHYAPIPPTGRPSSPVHTAGWRVLNDPQPHKNPYGARSTAIVRCIFINSPYHLILRLSWSLPSSTRGRFNLCFYGRFAVPYFLSLFSYLFLYLYRDTYVSAAIRNTFLTYLLTCLLLLHTTLCFNYSSTNTPTQPRKRTYTFTYVRFLYN